VSARAVRRVVVAVCVVGIAGMIAGSVADNNDVALTFGLLTAAAVACLMVATAVGAGPERGGTEGALDEEQARRVEGLVGDLVADGAEEARVRELVAEAVRLGRGAGPRAPVEEEGRG
jgi:hypothetical protein